MAPPSVAVERRIPFSFDQRIAVVNGRKGSFRLGR